MSGTDWKQHAEALAEALRGISLFSDLWKDSPAHKKAQQALAAYEAAAAQAVPDGWKLVPVEPTDEMLRAEVERLQRALHDSASEILGLKASFQAASEDYNEAADKLRMHEKYAEIIRAQLQQTSADRSGCPHCKLSPPPEPQEKDQ